MIESQFQPFGDRLAALVEERESQLVLGLDPDPAKLWPNAIEAVDGGQPANELAAQAVSEHCRSVIAAVGADCVGVKLQLACFERLGAPGWRALTETVEAVKSAGLIAIADGKRGDVPVTAAAYAQALFGSTSSPWGDIQGLGADAATVNPLLGADSLEPIVEQAVAAGAGVFALVRTSNPGAEDIEALEVRGTDDATVTDHLARLVENVGASSVGTKGLSSLGAVVGATAPTHIERLRQAMPHAVFLMPGVGAQGGRVEDLAAAFAAGRASALVTVSRALVNAWESDGGQPDSSARSAAGQLRESIWSISG
ncbi:MAG: orotidine-5'-phosphate decarboxylase [Solirubrobacterales bacterium]